jgi:hypothetical protein
LLQNLIGRDHIARHKWEQNIKMDLRGKGCEDAKWYELPEIGTQ